MEIWISQENATTAKVDLLVCVVRSAKKQGIFKVLDQATEGILSQIAKERKFKGKKDQQFSTPIWNGLEAKRLLVLGIGEESLEERGIWMKLAAKAVRYANRCKSETVALLLPKSLSSHENAVTGMTLGTMLAAYQYTIHKSEQKKQTMVSSLGIILPEKSKTKLCKELKKTVAEAQILAESICAARDLVNAPPNFLTPENFAERAETMAEQYQLDCTVFDVPELEERGFRLLLAVGTGSIQDSRLVHLVYRPPGYKKRNRLFLVGKGVTFDSGGLSLKPSASMLGMHADMAGAAAVFGAMQAIAQLQPNIEVHGILGMTENMTGNAAYRLNDVITGYNGKTVEIRNTDAEGRLVLADALSYASEQKATHIIDVATLTGACLVALGPNTAGVMGNSQKMADKILRASEQTDESMWQLPLLESLKAGLKSNIADMGNVGSRYGGSISAALFLQEFVGKDIKWTHLDIAGPAFSDKPHGYTTKGGTGFAVATLTEYACMIA